MYSCLFLMDANHATRVRMRLMIHMTMTTGKQALSKVNSGSSTLWGRKMPIYVMAAHDTRELANPFRENSFEKDFL